MVIGEGTARPTLAIDLDANRWTLQDLNGSAQLSGFRLQPPRFPIPLENVGGPNARVEIRAGVVVLNNISATYGGDEWLVRSARIPIPDDPRALARHFAIDEIDGRITFHRPNPEYPRKFGKIVENLRPAGPFEIGGGSFFHVNRVVPPDDGPPPEKPKRSDWFFSISSDSGALLLTKKDIELTNIRGDATVSNLLVDIQRLNCSVLGGAATASGKVVPRKPYYLQDGKVFLREIDLAQLGRKLRPEKPNDKLVGRGFLNLIFAGALAGKGEVKPQEMLRGQGEFEVLQGHFWALPVLGEVASKTSAVSTTQTSAGPGTLGEAAGVFHIADGTIVLDNAAVNSPALGLAGSGTVSFNRELDLKLVAAPLGDWRERMRQSRIPLVGDVAGHFAAALQKLVNGATGTLLYQFRVTGTFAEPQVRAVPAPVLTDPLATLFGQMLNEQQKKPSLIESVRGKNP
jgi:hypothetical protein